MSKELIKSSNLRNKYLKNRSEEDRQRFLKPANLCSDLSISIKKQKKKRHCSTIDEKASEIICKVWKTALIEKCIINNKEIIKVLNNFFSNIIKNLNISQTNHSDSNF